MELIIWTAKLSKKRLAAWAAGLGAAVCALVLLAGSLGRVVPASAAVSPKGIRTAEDRLSYLAAYGWQVKEEPLAVLELEIPRQLEGEYADYLALQSEQGFELQKYAGKKVTRYVYEITNYPTGETGVQASLLIYKNRVVAAEVLSPALNGFIHGLVMPAGEPENRTLT